jgi:membrane-bound ClpP family serine protease
VLVVLGLIVLVAALVVGLAGVLGNAGAEHALNGGFALFGIEVSGSTGTVFLVGIVVGVAAMLGLGLLLAGARRAAVRGRTARRELEQSRRQTAAISQERDDLVDQRYANRSDQEK